LEWYEKRFEHCFETKALDLLHKSLGKPKQKVWDPIGFFREIQAESL
jgi:hypothetical protein